MESYKKLKSPSCIRLYIHGLSQLHEIIHAPTVEYDNEPKTPPVGSEPTIIIWPFHATLVVTKLARTPQRLKKEL
jgi:hypothetical protein